ncbi:MAG: hypothetical protein B6I25_06490 [Planctomycetales bacterium 4572_13]|nr:MAG: hypothetical protein B6I25_06490 [Planctomycetales bacterium 4572_13]
MNATKGFWKHTDNGHIYAIECTPFGQIKGACGPLDKDNLPDLETCEYGKDILIWIESTMTEGKLRRFNAEPMVKEGY